MKRLTIILSLVVAIVSLILNGCASVQAKLDNGIEHAPGQRIYVNATVLKW